MGPTVCCSDKNGQDINNLPTSARTNKKKSKQPISAQNSKANQEEKPKPNVIYFYNEEM